MTAVEVSERERQRLGTYKDMAIRSLRFLYNSELVGSIKTEEWVGQWLKAFKHEHFEFLLNRRVVRYV